MRSIIQKDRNRCYLCGRSRSSGNPLDEHHVFFGPQKKTSEKYGLKVYLCSRRCHNIDPDSVHMNAERCRALQAEAQKIAMTHYGWNIKDFVRIVGKNYTEDVP